MTSITNDDIREACLKIDLIVKELPKHFKNNPHINDNWLQRKTDLESYINQEKVTTNNYYDGREETHFISCFWARPGARDGPDECECYDVEKNVKYTKEIYDILKKE